jgi:ParB family chromosome partitioning protein
MQTIEELSASLKQKISDQPIEKIKLEETVSYSKHPFRVPENAALKALANDIKEHGLLEPIIVRVLGFGGNYEILSGHRRAAAQRMNEVTEIEARVIKVSDVEAAQIVINSNFLQRDKILPSERAKSYMLRNEYLKKERYGGGSAERTESLDRIRDVLAKEFNIGKTVLFSYIRLNYLIEEILELVDKGHISIKLGADLSYFPKGRQAVIYKYFFADKKAALNADAIKRMKEYNKPDFNEEAIDSIIAELRKLNKKGSPMTRFKKRYEGNFKNEEEFCALMENLLLDYYERKNIPYKTKEVN